MYKGSTGYKPSRQFTILLVGKMDKEGKHKQIRKKRKRKLFKRYNLFSNLTYSQLVSSSALCSLASYKAVFGSSLALSLIPLRDRILSQRSLKIQYLIHQHQGYTLNN